MEAASYEQQRSAREVLTVGEMPAPTPGTGEVQIRLAASGINPGDMKKRQDQTSPHDMPHIAGLCLAGDPLWGNTLYGVAGKSAVVEHAIYDMINGSCIGFASLTSHTRT